MPSRTLARRCAGRARRNAARGGTAQPEQECGPEKRNGERTDRRLEGRPDFKSARGAKQKQDRLVTERAAHGEDRQDAAARDRPAGLA